MARLGKPDRFFCATLSAGGIVLRPWGNREGDPHAVRHPLLQQCRRRPRARVGQPRRRLGAPPDRGLHPRRAGRRRKMTDLAWIEAALTAARPQALAALLRYFRDLDTAEEAFQEASLRALGAWPRN